MYICMYNIYMYIYYTYRGARLVNGCNDAKILRDGELTEEAHDGGGGGRVEARGRLVENEHLQDQKTIE